MLARFHMASAPQHTSIDVIASALEPMMPAVSRMSSPDGAVTMMLSDIADAESLAAELGPEAWERLLRDHHALVEQLVGHHDGQVVKFENDGFLASFNSAHGGLHAAVELQRTFEAAPEHIGDGRFSAEPTVTLRAIGHIYAGWALSQDFYRETLHITALGAPDLETYLRTDWEASFTRRRAAI